MKYLIGIDEVGRGSLAGPLLVAAVSLPRGLRLKKGLGKLKDSKKLTALKREQWFKFLRSEPKIKFALARVQPRTIERMNVSRAANLAALRAFQGLISNFQFPISNCKVLLDGGLYLGNKRGHSQIKRGLTRKISGLRLSAYSERWSARTVVRGDEKFTSVKLASILAKVSRDRFMGKLGRLYPQYGFEKNKGYATRAHIRAIRSVGPSELHRATFIKNFVSV